MQYDHPLRIQSPDPSAKLPTYCWAGLAGAPGVGPAGLEGLFRASIDGGFSYV